MRRGERQQKSNTTALVTETDTKENSNVINGNDLNNPSAYYKSDFILDSTKSIKNSSMSTTEFDSLRREATKLERHLEDRVAKYQHLAQRMTTSEPFNSTSTLLDSVENGTLHSSSNNSSSKNNSAKIEEEESFLRSDISRTISQMSDLVNVKMSNAAERTGKSQHSQLVKRYREILFDCSADFKKTSATISRRRDQMELFNQRGKDRNALQTDSNVSATDQLLRERNAIGSSLSATRNILGQAEEIRGDLRNQGSSLRGAHGSVMNIANQVPGLNSLMDNIRRKRNRDDIIVSGVIAMCILFTLWYVFS